jgi:hypothetical protein
MAETVERHLRMHRGESAVWLVTVTDAAGAPVNITGAAMRFTAKLRASDADAAAVFAKAVGTGIVLTTPASGIATVTLAATDTAALAAGRDHLLQYDWKMTLSGITTTVAFGSLLVEAAMTRTAP